MNEAPKRNYCELDFSNKHPENPFRCTWKPGTGTRCSYNCQPEWVDQTVEPCRANVDGGCTFPTAIKHEQTRKNYYFTSNLG